MTDSQLALVVEGQALSDARIVDESERCGFVTVLHRIAETFDDHTTTYLKCNDCEKRFVVTDFVNGRCDVRPMTEQEIAKYA